MIAKEQIQQLENHYIITKHRSGSTLLSIMLGSHSCVQTIHEENIHEKLKSKYSSVIFNNIGVVEQFLEDLYQFSNHTSTHYYLPSKSELINELSLYTTYSLNFRQFVNLVYLFFYSNIHSKTVKKIINKDIAYHVSVSRIHKQSPNAKFIFLVRDSVININSVINTTLKNKNEVYHAVLWKYIMKDMLNSMKLLPDTSYRLVKFKDLIENTEETLKDICKFLSIDFEIGMLDNVAEMKKIDDYAQKRFYEENNSIISFENDIIHASTRNNINKNKIDNYILNKKQLNKIYRITNDVSMKYGYNNNIKNNKTLIPFNFFDLYYTTKGWFHIFLMYSYYSSSFLMKVFLRKVNIFKLYK